MKTYKARYTTDALDDLASIFDFIAPRSGARIAEGFVARLQAACPFTVEESREEVIILGVFYGGRGVSSAAAGGWKD